MRFLSLFSGIEAASVAWRSMGWEAAGFSEVDTFCNAVLADRFPSVTNLGDITYIKEGRLDALAPFSLVVFGSPCQDLSIAGRRSGLDGERSGLFRQAVRLIRYARQHCGCRFVLWENVPGALSSAKGKDFAEVLRLLSGSRQAVPDKGWKTGGIAWGPDALVEWRVLDAQYFGVPQRRRRIFALADFGDWSGRSPVLFESESLSGHSQTSPASREDIAGTLESRASAGGFPGTDGACAHHVIPVPFDLQSFGQYGRGDKSSTVQSRDYKNCTDLVICGTQNDYCRDAAINLCPTLRKGDNGGVPLPCVAIPIHDQATRYAGKRADKKDGKGNGLGIGQPDDPMNTLTSDDHHAVALFKIGQSAEAGGIGYSTIHSPTLTHSSSGTQQAPGLLQKHLVRRLTPLECERLQGFPDNWTRIAWKGKKPEDCPVTPRYKAIGNSMAVPVMRWIGQRLNDVPI